MNKLLYILGYLIMNIAIRRHYLPLVRKICLQRRVGPVSVGTSEQTHKYTVDLRSKQMFGVHSKGRLYQLVDSIGS